MALVVALTLLAVHESPDPGPRVLTTTHWPRPAEFTKTTEPYVNAADPADQLYVDLYQPAGAEPVAAPPVIVYVHGGGWFQGTRSEPALTGASPGKAILAQVRRGFVVASVDYTSSFRRPFPQAVLDIKTAVRHLRAHGFARSRIIVAGSSAGGHLAVMVAVTAGVDRFEPVPGEPTRVDAAVSLDGPLELGALQADPWLARSWFPGNEPGPVTDHFGPTLESGEMLPALVGCPDPRVPLSLGCQALVGATIGDASPLTWADDTDPPLYLACNTANLLLPDCAHDHRPFADEYIRRHHGSGTSAWVDELGQSTADSAIAHFTVDQHLDFAQLSTFLDRSDPAVS